MENIEARIRRLEAFVLGQNIDYQPADEQVLKYLKGIQIGIIFLNIIESVI